MIEIECDLKCHFQCIDLVVKCGKRDEFLVRMKIIIDRPECQSFRWWDMIQSAFNLISYWGVECKYWMREIILCHRFDTWYAYTWHHNNKFADFEWSWLVR